MSCNHDAIIQELTEIKALVLDLLQARKAADLYEPFHMRADARRAAALADQAKKQERKHLRQPSN